MPFRRLKIILISVCLAIIVLAVFWPVVGHDFILYDDGSYVFENPHVLKGWSFEGLKWAFTTTVQLHWHPLTWLSLMTDIQLFGLDPGAFHFVNLVIHILNTLLLFYVLTQMTGAVYRSAFVAALFGLHPLHVEPVAWIADRKDLLSALFWMTTLWLYLRYVRKPKPRNAVLVFVSFLCSLMAKSMSVTLPFILLMLDYWPLKRLESSNPEALPAQTQAKPASKSAQGNGKKNPNKRAAYIPDPGAGIHRPAYSIGRLLLEKVLLFFPMIIGAGITLMVIHRHKVHSINLLGILPSMETLKCTVVAYTKYLYQMLYPTGLAIPYPRVRVFPLWEIMLSICVLSAFSFMAYRQRKRHPYLLVGWLWYLVALLPAIGLVQSGPHSQADRYTYVPLVGIFIIIAWGSVDLFARSRYRQWILGGGAALCILACMAVSWAQVGRWKDTLTIFSHSVRVTESNYVAHTNLGLKLLQSGKTDEAISHFMEAIRIQPKAKLAHVNLGNSYREKNDLTKAIDHYEKALAIDPKYVNASYNLAIVYLDLNKLDLCEKYLLETIENDKQNYRAHFNLAAAYSRMGKSAEAINHLRECIHIQPGQYQAYYGLGLEYFKMGDLEQAEFNWNRVLEIRPDFGPARYNLGKIMMKRGNYDEADRHFSKALEINPGLEEARQSLEEVRRKKMSNVR